MNRLKVTVLRDAIEKAMKDIERDHGVTLELGRARFSAEAVRFQFNLVENATATDGSSVKVSLKEVDFRQNYRRFGLELSDLGRVFLCQGQKYTIVGSKRRNHRYPILANDVNGKSFKFPVAAVVAGLTKKN